jgi:hypothetical protein
MQGRDRQTQGRHRIHRGLTDPAATALGGPAREQGQCQQAREQ